jgi:uncharacterized protein DUF6130
MSALIKTLTAVAAGTLLATSAFAQSAGPSTLIPTENEPAPTLIVDQPLAGPLTQGVALIPYRVENVRILPVVGEGAVDASPRVGHLHVTLDDLPWHWADFAQTNTIVVAGLPPGQHKVLVEVASAEHHVFTGETVTFTVPEAVAHAN